MVKKKLFCTVSCFIIATLLQVPQHRKVYAADEGNNIPILAVNSVKSSGNDGNVAENTIDGNLITRWASSGDGEWIEFDLGKSQSIGYVGIAFNSGDKRSAKFDINVSTDDADWKTVYSGDSSGKTLDLESFDFNDVDAQYIKIVGHGNTANKWNSFSEVQIYPPNENGAVVNKLEISAPVKDPNTKAFTKAGLYNVDGTEHTVSAQNTVTGSTIDVTEYGADIEDNGKDDAAAIQKAIDVAKPGDEVYLPNGVYNLNTTPGGDVTCNINLKEGVNLRGESKDKTILMSSFNGNTELNTRVIKAYGIDNVLISNLTVTSIYSGKYSTDTKVKNPEVGGPLSGIYITFSGVKPSSNITIDNIIVEKFQRMGVRIEKSHDVVVQNSLFRNATDVAGGGAGYGVTIQGTAKVDRLGMPDDCYFNLVQNCTFTGPYIRHGTLLQCYAHNNTVRDNQFLGTLLDAVDLHGEFEYLNEVYGNTMKDIITGAGVGLGNTGGTYPTNHSASGPNNYIHDNTIENCKNGVTVIMGTPDTIIENNIIENSTVKNSAGVLVLNGPRTIIKGNKITNNLEDNAWGIVLDHDKGDPGAKNIGAGDPKDIQILNNTISNNANGVRVETGSGVVIQDNDISNNKETDLVNKSKDDTQTTGETSSVTDTDTTLFLDNFDDSAVYPGTVGNTALSSPWIQEGTKGSLAKTAYSTTASHSAPNRVKISGTVAATLPLDTTGYENIKVGYWTQASSYKSGSIIVEWSKDGGTTWTQLEDFKLPAGVASQENTEKSWALGAEASNNANFRVRFRVGDTMTSNMYIDDVSITGQAMPGVTPIKIPIVKSRPVVETEKTFKVPKGVTLLPNVEIGTAGNRPLLMAIAFPTTPAIKPMPVVVYIHGGGWNKEDRLGAANSIGTYVAKGYIGVSLDYRLTGEAPFPAQIEDVKLAIRYLRANADKYSIDPDRIGVWGTSAGGHLASLLGTTADEPTLEGTGGYQEYSDRVQAVCDFYGPADFTTDFADGYSSVTALLGGKRASLVPEAAKNAMPGTYASKDDPAFFIRHGDADATIPYTDSVTFAKQLEDAGVYVDFKLIPDGHHGFKGNPLETQTNNEAWAFLDKYVKNLDVTEHILKK